MVHIPLPVHALGDFKPSKHSTTHKEFWLSCKSAITSSSLSWSFVLVCLSYLIVVLMSWWSTGFFIPFCTGAAPMSPCICPSTCSWLLHEPMSGPDYIITDNKCIKRTTGHMIWYPRELSIHLGCPGTVSYLFSGTGYRSLQVSMNYSRVKQPTWIKYHCYCFDERKNSLLKRLICFDSWPYAHSNLHA